MLLDIVKSPLFRNSFLRVKLKENCELEGTDNAPGQIYKHIFAPNPGYCVYYTSIMKTYGKIFINSLRFAWHVLTFTTDRHALSSVTTIKHSLILNKIGGQKVCKLGKSY